MAKTCTHLDTVAEVTPSAKGCKEYLRSGSRWLHLRVCQACGHVGCCDRSPSRQATAHFRATGHPIIEGYDSPGGWGWCYVDRIEVEVGQPTPQSGRIPRFG